MRGVQRGLTTTFIVLVILAGTIVITSIYINYYLSQKQKAAEINSFEDCAKVYPVMESYPEQCATPDGKHFTKEYAYTPASTPDPVIWANYQDETVSLVYPIGFNTHHEESDVLREPNFFTASGKEKFLGFYAPQSDNGFFLQFWSNDKNLSVKDWWEEQFVSGGKNIVFGEDQTAARFVNQPKKVGSYDLYLVDHESPASFELFKFKNYIVLFVSSRFEEDNKKILEGLK